MYFIYKDGDEKIKGVDHFRIGLRNTGSFALFSVIVDIIKESGGSFLFEIKTWAIRKDFWWYLEERIEENMKDLIDQASIQLWEEERKERSLELELLREEHIVNFSKKKEKTNLCFVYFLINKKRIVYVGKTIQGIKRIYDHEGRFDFDAYNFISCGEEEVLSLEGRYIRKFNPEHNQIIPKAHKTVEQIAGTIYNNVLWGKRNGIKNT